MIRLPALIDEVSVIESELEFLTADIESQQREGIEQKKYIQLLKRRAAAKKSRVAVLSEIEIMKEFEKNVKKS